MSRTEDLLGAPYRAVSKMLEDEYNRFSRKDRICKLYR
jgi:hypothetical protein